MITQENATHFAADLVARARRLGADASDAVFSAEASTDVQMRLWALEDVTRSESEAVSLRVFVGKRTATSSSSDLSPAALDALAQRVFAMAQQAPEDAYAGLAPEKMLLRGAPPELDVDDGKDVSPEQLREAALACEEAARAVPGISNSEGASASAGRAVFALATSHGFVQGVSKSSYGLSASVLAQDGSGMERDYDYDYSSHWADVRSPADIGQVAGERTVMRLGAKQLKSGALPMVFDPRVGGTLLGHLMGAINGAAIARKSSFLLESLGAQIFSSAIQVQDNPHRLRGLASRGFDAEGLPTAPCNIIEDGVLTTWLIDAASGRQLGLAPTGHATRGGASASNLHMQAGDVSPAELMRDIKHGFYVTELIGMGVNGLTGDYSRGASGFCIENGELTHAVHEVTIAGNLKQMFMALTPANDLVFRYATNVPTLRVDGMTLAGA
jgi:PmbA protein